MVLRLSCLCHLKNIILIRWLTALTKIKFGENYIPRMNAGLEKATHSAMPVQPSTERSKEGACPASSSRRPTSSYKFVSHTPNTRQ